MKTLNKYDATLQNFIAAYKGTIPENVIGIDGASPCWDDPVWYIKDPETGVLHRYLCLTATKGVRRETKDTIFKNLDDYSNRLFVEPYASFLKIYILAVQSHNVVNNSKQLRVLTACQILTEAQKNNGLNNVPNAFWSNIKSGNIFWDYCKSQRIISGQSRPVHKDRERGADFTLERSTNYLKMTSNSMVYALGDIFNRVFEHVDADGNLFSGKKIDIQDAIAISVALLGLASPNRLNGEVPLLQDQKLKKIQPEHGESVFYIDWPGSKGYQDNHNHILKVLAPQVKKVVNFFHYYLKPERHYIRFLKDPNCSWQSILNGFNVDKARQKYLDLNSSPNIFSVAFALGFYPIEHWVPIVKERKFVEIRANQNKTKVRYPFISKWDYELKRRYKLDDFFEYKHIAQLKSKDVLLNTTGVSNKNGVFAALKTSGINVRKRKELKLPLITNVESVEDAVITLIKEEMPTFPVSFADSDKGIDMEHALFCISPGKHNIVSAKGLAGSPLYIYSCSKIKSLFVSRLNPSNNVKHLGIFYKYGFGHQKLRLHSLRHFSNTQAEKGGIPLSVIAVWSGRSSIKQTLEYVHTSEEEKSDRLISTLDFDTSEKDIKLITKEELKNTHGMPASLTETGVCVQELTVTPCNYINDFLSGCFGCESACYVCGDKQTIQTLQYDLNFQTLRLEKLHHRNKQFVSKANQEWWLKHSIGTYLLEELIKILETSEYGSIVRIADNKTRFYITNLKTKAVKEHKLLLPSKQQLLEYISTNSNTPTSKVPSEMTSILGAFGLDSKT